MQEKDDQDIKNETLFFEAIKNSNIPELVKFFRNENIKPWEYFYEDEYNGLHRAAFLDLYLVVCTMIDEMKIRLGIDAQKQIEKWVNQKSKRQGYTALHYASFNGNIDIIEKLIKYKADIETSNNRGLNVLHMAAQGNSPNTLVYFKEKYNMNIQSVDEICSTPLHWACYSGSQFAINFLLSWEINLNYKDKEGITPLHLAVMSERTEIIKKLLQKGANRHLKDNKGRTPYDLAVEKNKNFLLEMLKDKTNCQLFQIKMPLEKLEKNKINIILFIALHLILEIFAAMILIPYCHSSENKILDAIYLIFFFLIFILYFILLFMDPGMKIKNSQDSLLKLVENREQIKEFCPTCIVKKEFCTRHCLICDACIEGFDHHCNWLNKCIGKRNLYIFWIFLIMTSANIVLNLEIGIESLIYEDYNQSIFANSLTPNKNLKLFIAFCIIITSILFIVPVVYLLYSQTKTLFKKGIDRAIRGRKIQMNYTNSSIGAEESLINKKHIKSLIIHDTRERKY